MTTIKLTSAQIKNLRLGAIAQKYNCSEDYVRRVLKGERQRNSELSQKIMADSIDILRILNRET